MALGVALSQAARGGELHKVACDWNESAYAYLDNENAKGLLFERVQDLKDQEVERIVEWLMTKCNGDAVRANVHLAVRARASMARFAKWVDEHDYVPGLSATDDFKVDRNRAWATRDAARKARPKREDLLGPTQWLLPWAGPNFERNDPYPPAVGI